MLCEDAQQLAGTPHNRGGGRVGRRWGRTKGKIGFHGGKVAVHRPRVRSYDGHELALATWTAARRGLAGRPAAFCPLRSFRHASPVAVLPSAAWAAARRAMGTRNGEHET